MASSLDGSPITAADLERVRAALPAATARAYLNAGMLGPLTQQASEAMARFAEFDLQQRYDDIYWERLVDVQGRARTAIGSLTGVDHARVALMHTTHEGINACLWGLPLNDGANSVVTTDEEHPGVLVPLRHARDRRGIEVRIAAWHDSATAFVDSVLAQVDGTTRAVVLSHVSWTSGRIAPLRELRAALPDSVRLIVDGAQGGGALEVALTDGWDAYTVSGQKWPLGPNGSGGLAVREPGAWEPTFGAFMQVSDYTDCLGSELVQDGRRFESSQEAIAPLSGIAASIEWLVGEVGLARAHAHARAGNAYARHLLGSVNGIARCNGLDHLLCIELAAPRADAVIAAADAHGVAIRSLTPSSIRLSIGAWVTREDIERGIEAITAGIEG